jgi:hypothetical protein
MFKQLFTSGSGPVRLFIFSGQSNMKHLVPDKEFIPIVSKAFPNNEIVAVKLAVSGQPIRRWHADWNAGVGEDVKKPRPNGDMYKTLLDLVTNSIKSKPKPVSVTFLWMQGEADTHEIAHANVYKDSLKAVINQLRTDLGRPDMGFVVGRISDYAEFPEGSKIVRDAIMEVADGDPIGRWVDTDDLNGKLNGLHYTGPGYQLLGERFAEKTLELLNGKTEGGKSGAPTAVSVNAVN